MEAEATRDKKESEKKSEGNLGRKDFLCRLSRAPNLMEIEILLWSEVIVMAMIHVVSSPSERKNRL